MSTRGEGLEQALGKRLQAARKAAGLTQQDLCYQAKLSYSTLAKIERGAIKAPSIFTIESIADVLGTSLDQLVGRDLPASTVPKKTSKNGVSFVYFDINGCVVRFYHRAFTKLAEEAGVTADVVETAFWRYNDAICRGGMTLDEFNQALAQALGIESVDWQQLYLEAVEPVPGMHELLTWVAEHYQVGFITNIMPGLVTALLDHDLLPKLDYAAVVDSSIVHTIKPEPEVYQLAQEQAHVQPNEILFVDDSRANIMAAAHSGWHVLGFDESRPEESIKRIKAALEF